MRHYVLKILKEERLKERNKECQLQAGKTVEQVKVLAAQAWLTELHL